MASSSTSVPSFETDLAESIRERGGNASSGGSNNKYPYPCHVNPASFVSIKLYSVESYALWQEQMMCLIKSHDMLGFIDGTLKNPMEHPNYIFNKESENIILGEKYREWERSDALVKGWIFGSLSEYVMGTVVGLQTAKDVWEKLKPTYPPPPDNSTFKKDLAEYLPLCRAIIKNDWETAKQIFNQDKDALTAQLNILGMTALHIAIDKAECIQFVKNLLEEIHPESLPTLLDNINMNPLHYASYINNTMAAKMLVEKNPSLLFILDLDFSLPIHRASLFSHRTTFLYLLDACKKYLYLSQPDGFHSPFEREHGNLLLFGVIRSGFSDAANEMIKYYPPMATTSYIRASIPIIPLRDIASMRYLYHSGTRYNWYQRLVYAYVPAEKNRLQDTDIENQETYKAKCLTKSIKTCFYNVPHVKHLQDEKVKHQEAVLLLKSICEEVAKINIMNDIRIHYEDSMGIAVYNDTPEVVEQLIKYFPSAIVVSPNRSNILLVAIINRCEKVYNFLLCHLSHDQHFLKQLLDIYGNNPLHLAGLLAPIDKLNRVSGAALQMQRELQWFKEVENSTQPINKDRKNNAGETPIMVFRREHNQLRKDGEAWMKKTADSNTIVAALIITIVFAAAITVPGGNDDGTGKAIYETNPSFIVFAVSDAISLFSSTTSLLLFLSILTARYQEEDFLYKLPKRLILGLAMLFLSVSSMMVAFSATLYLMFGHGRAWVLIPIATLTCLPIASFVTLQLPLLVDLISSTYGRGIFAKQSDRKLKQS